jgi:hypothetical protein
MNGLSRDWVDQGRAHFIYWSTAGTQLTIMNVYQKIEDQTFNPPPEKRAPSYIFRAYEFKPIGYAIVPRNKHTGSKMVRVYEVDFYAIMTKLARQPAKSKKAKRFFADCHAW